MSAASEIQEILDRTALHYGVTVRELTSERRAPRVARPRQVAMFLASELTKVSLPGIGRAFGRHHTTVMHAIGTVRKLRDEDSGFAARIAVLEAECRAALPQASSIDVLLDDVLGSIRVKLLRRAAIDPQGVLAELVALSSQIAEGEARHD